MSPRRSAWWQLLAAFAALPVLTAFAAAQSNDSSRATAHLLGEQGIKAYWAGDYTAADTALDHAFQLFAAPTLGLWSGRARVKLERWVEAAERFREAARSHETAGDSAVQEKARTEAHDELETLLPRIPLLTITLDDGTRDDVTVTLDDKPLPSAMLGADRPTNPGLHHVTAQRGSQHFEARVELSPTEHERVVMHLAQRAERVAGPEPEPEPDAFLPLSAATATAAEPTVTASSPSAMRPLAIVALSLGGAGLVASGVTALLANGKLGQCPDRVCSDASVKSSYDTLRTISMVSVYAGGALALGGLVMWLLAPGQEQSRSTHALLIGPGNAAVRGSF
jgi:hypothetical protein